MEESVKRRERLKAMRTEASQTDGSNNVEASSIPGFLSNPLVETSASLPAHDFSAAPRFDYYTDPLSAFSGSKKRSMPETRDDPTPPTPSNVGSSIRQSSLSHQGAWNPAMPPPAHQFHANYNHGQRMYPPQAPPYNSGPPCNSGPPHNSGPPYNSGPPHNSGPQGFPMGNPFSMPQPNCFPPNPPYPNPGSGQMGRSWFSSGQVRGNWSSQSPGPNPEHGSYSSHGSGRGRDHQFSGRGMSPGGGRGRGRGRGSPARGELPSPERLYHKSMVEDPWKFCQPVKWKILETRSSFPRTAESPQSWLPKSISVNSTRAVEASNMSRSESLAESLAASLYETVNEDDKQGM